MQFVDIGEVTASTSLFTARKPPGRYRVENNPATRGKLRYNIVRSSIDGDSVGNVKLA